MIKNLMSVALAAAFTVSLTGCYNAMERAQAEQQAQAAVEKDQAVEAGQRHFNEARVAAQTLQSQLASKDWEKAADGVIAIRQHLETIVVSKKIVAKVKAQVKLLMPTVYALHARVQERQADSIPLARNLVTQFDDTAKTLVGLGFLATQGGGAGQGDDIRTPVDDELNEDLETPTNIEE
jgi:hypothetical protein